MIEKIKREKWITILLVLVSFFVLLNLGNTHLYIDEANTGYLAKNVLRFGYPRAFDGENMLPAFYDGSFKENYAWVEQPWLQYYITALSIKLFGVNSFAARIPFAIIGILSILIIYKLAFEITQNKVISRITGILNGFSVPFLLFARNCRYYSLVFFFAPLLCFLVFKWAKSKEKKYLYLYGLTSIMLFYSFYPIWFCMVFSLLIYIFIKDKTQLCKFLITNLITGICILPWIIWGTTGGPAGSEISLQFMLNEGLFLYIWKIHAYIFPFIPLLFIYAVLKLLCKLGIIKFKSNIQIKKEYIIYVGVLLYLIVISFVPMVVSQYLVGIIPFLYLLMSILIVKIGEINKTISVIIVLIVMFTNLLNISPFILLKNMDISAEDIESVVKNPQSVILFGATPSLKHFLEESMEVRFYLFDYLYEITHDYDTRISGIIKELQEKGEKSDVVLSWWGDAHVLLFHTDMRILYHPFPMSQNKVNNSLAAKYDGYIDWIVNDGIFKQSDLCKSKLDENFGNIDISNYFEYDLNDYEKIELTSPKMYFEQQPNIEFHNFKTNTDAPNTYIYKLK